jgi:transcriptional regulator with XRE-family HTH domain
MRIVIRKGARNVFGPALRRAREESRLHLTQSDLAEIMTEMGLSIDRSAISRIENQERAITEIEVMYFCAALRIDPAKLFSLMYREPSIIPSYEDIRSDEDDFLQIRVAEDDPNTDLLR